MSEENTLSRLVYIGQALANNIKHIHLHATGSDFDFIHNTAQEYYEELSDEIDDFSEIAISKGEKVDNLNNLRSNLEDDFWAEPLTDEMYDMEAFVAYMQEAGTKWIKELEDSPLEGLYKDEYLRFWKKEIEYKNEMKSIKRGGQHESDNFNKDGEIEISDEDDDTCCNDEITSGLPPVDWKDAVTIFKEGNYGVFSYDPIDFSGNGTCTHQTCLWIRPAALLQTEWPKDVTLQVCGHTELSVCPAFLEHQGKRLVIVDSELHDTSYVLDTENLPTFKAAFIEDE